MSLWSSQRRLVVIGCSNMYVDIFSHLCRCARCLFCHFISCLPKVFIFMQTCSVVLQTNIHLSTFWNKRLIILKKKKKQRMVECCVYKVYPNLTLPYPAFENYKNTRGGVKTSPLCLPPRPPLKVTFFKFFLKRYQILYWNCYI